MLYDGYRCTRCNRVVGLVEWDCDMCRECYAQEADAFVVEYSIHVETAIDRLFDVNLDEHEFLASLVP